MIQTIKNYTFGINKPLFINTQSNFLGGVLGNDGIVYLIPYSDTNIIGVKEDRTIKRVQAKGYGSAALGVDNNIYMSPSSGGRFSKYNPTNNTVTHIGNPYPISANFCLGSVLAQNGNVFSFGTDSSKFYEINVSTGNIIEYNGVGNSNGAILHSDGFIYVIPNSQINMYKINPFTKAVTNINTGVFIGGGVSIYGGAVYAFNEKIYLIPRNHTHIREFNPITNVFTNVGPNFGTGDKFSKGSLLPNGNILLTPFNYTKIIEFNPNTYEVIERGDATGYYGSVLNRLGEVVLTPFNPNYIRFYESGIPLNPSDYTIPSNLANLPTSNYNKFFNKF